MCWNSASKYCREPSSDLSATRPLRGRATGGETVTHVDARGLRRLAAQQLEITVDSIDAGVIVLGDDGHVNFVNAAAVDMLALAPGDVDAQVAARAAGLRAYGTSAVPVPPELRHPARALRSQVPFSQQVCAVDLPDGRCRWLLVSARPVVLAEADTSSVVITFVDLTPAHAAVERLVHQANHDPLTGLPNRGFILRRITDSLGAADGVRLTAVLFIDLDDLKTINDALGHDAGDALLKAAATRLRQSVGSAHIVGRHGGDEFVALIFGRVSRAELEELTERLQVALAEPVVIAGTSTRIRASVGVVEVDDCDDRSAHEILRDADRAMYEAKRAGRASKRG